MRFVLPMLVLSLFSAQAQEQPVVQAEESAFTTEGYITVSSDYVWRGITQTDGKPGIQGEVGLYHNSGFYGEIWAGRMDFDDPGDGISWETDLVIGWATDLAENLSLDISILRAFFPGSNPGYYTDYTEYALTLGFLEYYEFTVAYSDDLFHLGDHAVYYELTGDWPIGETPWGVRAGAGLYDLQKIAGDRYSHGYLAAYYNLTDALTIDAGYYRTFGFGSVFEDTIAPKDQAGDRVAVELTWSF